MKKLIYLLLVTITLTGCKINKINMSNYDEIINQVLTINVDLHNQTDEGYNYYLPKGISLYDSNDTNKILKYKNTRMYLYVDVISYYNKVKNEFTTNSISYYSKKIEYNDKFGYLEINKYQTGYFVEIMYNYAKIEVFVNEKDLLDTIYDSITILSSIEYKENIISSLIGNNSYNYKEEVYNIFKPIDTTDNYLDWEEDIYEDYDGEIKDEDSIILDDEETE